MIPLTNSLGGFGGGETAFAVGGDGSEGSHFGGADWEDVAVGGVPVGGVFAAVGEVEDLDFDALGEAALAGFEGLDGTGDGPDKDAGVAGGLVVTPLEDELEIGEFLLGADDADGLAGAVDGAVFVEGPGLGLAVDGCEVFFGHGPPTGGGAVDGGLGVLTEGVEDQCGSENGGRKQFHGII